MIEILRLSHRIKRDVRVSTHTALAAKAFGSSKIYYSGDKDKKMEETINKISKNFGGNFEIEYVKNPLSFVKKYKGFKIHLTMYGSSFKDKIKEIKKHKNILLIVGSEKVPPEYYHESDMNVAVGKIPHSEISALSILLYEIKNHKIPSFKNSKVNVYKKFISA